MGEQSVLPLPPPPEALTFPQSMLDDWFALPGNAYLEAAFTRTDLDTLFSSLNNSLQGQSALDQALVDWSNGRLAEANAALNESRRLRVESLNALKRFFMAIMTSAAKNANRIDA